MNDDLAFQFDELADSDGHLDSTLDCLAAAAALGLQGEGERRVCPVCSQQPPTLFVRPNSVECCACGFTGDAIELVRKVRNCATEQALTFLSRPPEANRREAAPSMTTLGAPALLPTPPLPSDQVIQLYSDFLSECRPVADRVLDLLSSWGISQDVIEATGIKFFTTEYGFLLDDLEDRFGTDLVLEAGLLRRASLPEKPERTEDEDDLAEDEEDDEAVLLGDDAVVGTFADYHEAKAPYLIVPYKWANKPVYLKAIPLVDAARMMEAKLPPFLATGPQPPCLFNHDAIRASSESLLFRKEFDAMIAASAGYPSAAYTSLALFKPIWAPYFRGRSAVLVMDSRPEPPQRIQYFLELLSAAGVESVRRVDHTASVSLPETLKKQLPRAQALELPAPTRPINREGDAQFITSIPIGQRRALVVHRQNIKGQYFFRLRFWCDNNGAWSPDKNSQTFLVAAENAAELATALTSVAAGKVSGVEPQWMSNYRKS